MALPSLQVVFNGRAYIITYAPGMNLIFGLLSLIKPFKDLKIPILSQEQDKGPCFVLTGIVTLEELEEW